MAGIRAREALRAHREARPARDRCRSGHAQLASRRAECRAGISWGRSDRLLGALRARGLEPVVTLWGTPEWANGGEGPNVAPLRGDDFERFAEAAAERYPYVSKWIMWNEPNKPIWLKPASARTYVSQILNPGYRGIKAVNPQARVAGGVTGPRAGKGGVSPVDFIRAMDAAGARLDAYAHHPYPVFPGDTPFEGGCVCETLTMASLERLLLFVGRAFPEREDLADRVRVPDQSTGRRSVSRRRTRPATSARQLVACTSLRRSTC